MKYFLTVAAVVLIGFAIKLSFWSGQTAKARADLGTPSMDVATLHANANAPLEKIHDMTFDSSGSN